MFYRPSRRPRRGLNLSHSGVLRGAYMSGRVSSSLFVSETHSIYAKAVAEATVDLPSFEVAHT